MTKSLSVKFKKTSPDSKGVGVYSIEAVVESATDMSPSIFVLQILPKYTDGSRMAVFSHVAHATDLEKYGDQQDTADTYYRVNSIKLVLDSAGWCDTVEQTLKKDIKYLVDSLNSSKDVEPEVVVF